MGKALKVKHIGILRALCDARRNAYLRTDLGAERYKQLGVTERFTGAEPYRICPKCISKLDTQWQDARRRKLRREKRHGDIDDGKIP